MKSKKAINLRAALLPFFFFFCMATWGQQKKLVTHKAMQNPSAVATAITFSVDDNMCAIGTGNGSVFLYSLKYGKMLKTFRTSTKGITSTDISIDKTFLAAASEKGKVLIWNVRTGKVIKQLPNDKMLHSIRFDHSGKFLLGTSLKISRENGGYKRDYTAYLWNIETSTLMSEIKDFKENIDIVSTYIDESLTETRLLVSEPQGTVSFDSTLKHYAYTLDINNMKLQFRSDMLSYDGQWVSNLNLFNPYYEINPREKAQIRNVLRQMFGEQVKGLIEYNTLSFFDLPDKSVDINYMSNHTRYYFINTKTRLKLYNAKTNKLIRELLL